MLCALWQVLEVGGRGRREVGKVMEGVGGGGGGDRGEVGVVGRAGVVDVARCAHDQLTGRSVGNGGFSWVQDAGVLRTCIIIVMHIMQEMCA